MPFFQKKNNKKKSLKKNINLVIQETCNVGGKKMYKFLTEHTEVEKL